MALLELDVRTDNRAGKSSKQQTRKFSNKKIIALLNSMHNFCVITPIGKTDGNVVYVAFALITNYAQELMKQLYLCARWNV